MAFPPFSIGDVLAASDMNAVGIWKIATGTFTGASNFEVTGFSSTYLNYEIRFSGIRTTAGAAILDGQLYQTTTARTSGMYAGNIYADYIAGTGSLEPSNNANTFYGGTFDGTYRANSKISVRYKSGEMFAYNIQGFDANNFRGFSGGGFRNSTETYDRIRFIARAGAVTGEWSLYGFRS